MLFALPDISEEELSGYALAMFVDGYETVCICLIFNHVSYIYAVCSYSLVVYLVLRSMN